MKDKIELDGLKKLAEAVVACLTDLTRFEKESANLDFMIHKAEKDIEEAGARYHAELAARQRDVERLADRIAMEPRARIAQIENSKYMHLQVEELQKLKAQLAANPETETERQYSRLMREPVRIDGTEYEKLNALLEPLIAEDKKIRKSQGQTFDRLAELAGRLREQVHEAATRPEWYLTGNRLNDDRDKLDRMRNGETPTAKRR